MQPTHTQAEAKVQPALPVRVKDLPVPPDLAVEIEQYCARRGWFRKRDREQVAEEIKFQYYFGGNCVAYQATPEGRIVLAVGRMDSAEFWKVLHALSREEFCRTIVGP